jgi:hypothetical protein
MHFLIKRLLATGLPTKDETVKTYNYLNMTISLLNIFFCLDYIVTV